MLAGLWAPLALLGLHAYLETTRRRWLFLYGATWMLQAAANGYMLSFFSALVGLWVLWFVVVPRHWRALFDIGTATVLASVPLAPIIFTYATVHARHGFGRSLAEIRFFSADVAAVLCAPSQLTFWGWLRVACRPEGELFPGVALFVLFAAGVTRLLGGTGSSNPSPIPRPVTVVRRVAVAVAAANAAVVAVVMVFGPWRIDWGIVHASSSSVSKPLLVVLSATGVAFLSSGGVWAALRRSSVAGFYVLAAFATWALALGPTITLMGVPRRVPGPFAWLTLFPGGDSLRVPARFWLMTTICLAVTAGIVVAGWSRTWRRPLTPAWLLLLATALLADGWVDRLSSAPSPEPVPDAALLRGGLVLTLPAGDHDEAAVYQAVTGGWTSVNGHSGYYPLYYYAVRLGSRTEAAELFQPFRSARDLHVVVATEALGQRAFVERQPGAVTTSSTPAWVQYRLPARPAPPPPAGGERLPIVRVTASCAPDAISSAIDGDPSSRWSCGPQSGREVLTADLGQERRVGAIRQFLGPPGDFPRQLVIDTSLDAAAWSHAWDGNVIAPVILGSFQQTRWPAIVLSFEPRPARFVRLRQVGRDDAFHWSVGELEVVGSRP